MQRGHGCFGELHSNVRRTHCRRKRNEIYWHMGGTFARESPLVSGCALALVLATFPQTQPKQTGVGDRLCSTVTTSGEVANFWKYPVLVWSSLIPVECWQFSYWASYLRIKQDVIKLSEQLEQSVCEKFSLYVYYVFI